MLGGVRRFGWGFQAFVCQSALDALLTAAGELSVRTIVVWGSKKPEHHADADGNTALVLGWGEFMSYGNKVQNKPSTYLAR